MKKILILFSIVFSIHVSDAQVKNATLKEREQSKYCLRDFDIIRPKKQLFFATVCRYNCCCYSYSIEYLFFLKGISSQYEFDYYNPFKRKFISTCERKYHEIFLPDPNRPNS